MRNRSIQKNISVLYILSFLNNARFWLGIWVLYYLLFTDFAGIGFIETLMIVSMFLFEVPSGAFADLIGKKKTIILSFFIVACAEFLMGFAGNISMLALSAFIGSLGATMLSGTFEAITFDSLKEMKRENLYEKTYSRQRSIAYVASAVATIVGGFLYKYIDPRAPFFVVGFMNIIACVIALRLIEPYIDTVKITTHSYMQQMKEGFTQLFLTPMMRALVVVLLLVSIVPLFMYEMLADILLVAYGANAIEVSFAIFIILSASAISVNFVSFFTKKLGTHCTLVISFFVYAVLLLFVPFINLYVGIILIAVLASISAINGVLRSQLLNQGILSEYRATTLSTFSMLLSIPYVIFAIILGHLSDMHTVQNVICVLGIIMIVFVLGSVVNYKMVKYKNEKVLV